MVTFDLETEEGRRGALRRMLLVREFEETASRLSSDGILEFATVHLCIGQEATAVGACAALDDDDDITGTHRGHGHAIGKGLDPKLMMAELAGRREGLCNGKGGSMHLADTDKGMLGANGVVGSGAPITAGAALANHMDDDGNVSLAFIGDGAMAQGQVHEALNLAATWDLPLIVMVENNEVGEFTLAEDQHNIEDLSETAAAYGIPGVTVDGMDVEAVFEAVEEARQRAVAGEGPTIVEGKTYRYHGHFESDPEPYREESEVERVREERDPIDTYRDRLIERGELTEDGFEELRADVEAQIEEAVEFASAAEHPDPEEAYEDMYADPVPEIEQFTNPTLL